MARLFAGAIIIPIGCDEAVFSTDRAFWIPAFAGMTDEGRRWECTSRQNCGVIKVNWYKYGRSSPPEEERFTSISAGGRHTCGLQEDGIIVCWGDNSEGQSSPPLR